ncbi:MAG TPA: alpha/beta fold hydrolase, partial [Bacillaceae bacterium]
MKICVEGVYYHAVTMGSGEPVILLHGFTGDTGTWSHLTRDLAKKYRVIAVDIIGHGKTESPADVSRYDISQCAEDVIHLLDELQIRQAHLLGYSMGGRLALTVAVLFPERVKSLMLESASPGLKKEVERKQRVEQDENLADMILGQGIERFTDYWESIPLFKTQKKLPGNIREQIRNQRMRNNPIGL